MHESTIARKLDALASEIRETRRLVQRVANHIAATQHQTVGVIDNGDNSMFLPGTGHVGGERTLSAEAQAALDALDHTNHQPTPGKATQ